MPTSQRTPRLVPTAPATVGGRYASRLPLAQALRS